MAEIGSLPPAYRVPPAQPGSGAGKRKQTPRRKQDPEHNQQEQRERRRKDDDGPHIDEYA